VLYYKIRQIQESRSGGVFVVDKNMLIREIETLPPDMIEEVDKYIGYLKSKRQKSADNLALASERSLAKDWLLPAEDVAWANL
jgi:hypothetical protein